MPRAVLVIHGSKCLPGSVEYSLVAPMAERIHRANDERLYQPWIHSELIRQLHAVKMATGLPMTVLVDMAIREMLARRQEHEGDSSIANPGDSPERQTDRGRQSGAGGAPGR